MSFTHCYDDIAKMEVRREQARFMRKVVKLLTDFEIEFRFNPGGIAVWGETYVKIVREAQPVVEACLSKDHSYIRQWDGRHSGRNITLNDNSPEVFAGLVNKLAAAPFRAC
jgi:hypothetical protein